jgi:hypothetical protein
MFKTQADTYAQLSFLKRNLGEKQQEQEELHHEKQDLLEQQKLSITTQNICNWQKTYL